jgi:hypothetical protein
VAVLPLNAQGISGFRYTRSPQRETGFPCQPHVRWWREAEDIVTRNVRHLDRKNWTCECSTGQPANKASSRAQYAQPLRAGIAIFCGC